MGWRGRCGGLPNLGTQVEDLLELFFLDFTLQIWSRGFDRGCTELALRGAGAYHAWRATGLKHNYLLSLPPLTKVQPGLRLLPAVGEGNAANVLRAGGQPTRRREAAGPVVPAHLGRRAAAVQPGCRAAGALASTGG